MFTGTLEELSAILKQDKATVYFLARYLELTGKAKVVGTKKTEGARGKGQNIYEVADSITLKFKG